MTKKILLRPDEFGHYCEDPAYFLDSSAGRILCATLRALQEPVRPNSDFLPIELTIGQE